MNRVRSLFKELYHIMRWYLLSIFGVTKELGRLTKSCLWRMGKPLYPPRVVLDPKMREPALLRSGLSPDGSLVATTLVRGHVAKVWDTGSGALIATLTGHEGRINSVAFSPDGRRVVTASDDNTARLWDPVTGAVVAILRGHEDSVNFADFSADSTRVVTASHDRTARVWDAASGTALAILKGHQDQFGTVAFSADGKRVVTGSWDDTARVWDATTGFCLAILSRGSRSQHSSRQATSRPSGFDISTSVSHETWLERQKKDENGFDYYDKLEMNYGNKSQRKLNGIKNNRNIPKN